MLQQNEKYTQLIVLTGHHMYLPMYIPTYACMQRTIGVVTIDLMTKEMMRKCFVQFCGLCNRDSEMKQW